jgi:hypothetical protein
VDLKELANRVKELIGGKRGGAAPGQPNNQDPGGVQPAGGPGSEAPSSTETAGPAMGADQGGAAGTQPGMQGDTQPGMQDQAAGADGQDAVDPDVGEPGTQQTP